MKKIHILKTLLLTSAVCLVSCTDWLDVDPKDKVMDDQVFGSEIKIREALNGIYLLMADANAYGKNLTNYSTELLGQRWNYLNYSTGAPDPATYFLITLDFEQKELKSHVDNIYAKGYEIILNINYFIDKLSQTEGVVNSRRKNLLLGEAYALRAYLHLDMLRLFGPVPSVNPESLSIPYVIAPTTEWQSRQSHTAIIGLILKDIETSLGLLADDSILTQGVVVGDDANEDDPDFFYSQYRNRRLNYYGVQALKMRTLMYSGTDENIQAAGQLARTLLEDRSFQKTFPWGKSEEFFDKGDRAFTTEVLFGIHVAKMYDQWSEWFGTSNANTKLLGTALSNVNYMFNAESYLSNPDWRTNLFVSPSSKEDRIVPVKFQLLRDAREQYQYFQPMIRKSEVFLTAAEVFQEERYIDSIRHNRGLAPLSEDPNAGGELQTQIEKEYMKEFISEGQLFYYYKRRNQETIRSYNGSTRTVTHDKYILPVPQAETNL